MEYLLSILIGILSSFVSALIFLFFLSRIRPKLEISNKIAQYKTSSGNTEYIIKVINRTRRPIINIKARLDIVTHLNVSGGWINNRIEIPLKIDSVFEILGFDNSNSEIYTWRFLTYQDLEEIWNNDESQILKFQIFAIDSISNFAKVFTKDYSTKRDCIVKGEFEYGNSLEIK